MYRNKDVTAGQSSLFAVLPPTPGSQNLLSFRCKPSAGLGHPRLCHLPEKPQIAPFLPPRSVPPPPLCM